MISGNWSAIVKQYRVRHSLTQAAMAATFGVSQRTISRWERGDDRPSLALQKQLRDHAWDPTAMLSARLFASVIHCPAPRALVRHRNMRLLALSQPAIDKRPSITDWIGRDLVRIAAGIQVEILDDRPLQAAIAAGEIACVLATTQSVLQTTEASLIGTYQTTITYFFHDDTLYTDSLSIRVPDTTPCGYRAIAMDDVLAG
jgi:DNA-binding XRE family transcriptional regulator